MFEKELRELGLSANEIKIYLALLQNGILNPTKLAEKTGLHRSYVYDTLERLLEKGIVNTVLINNKKNYQPVDPKVLREIFEIKLKQIDSIIPKLSNLLKQKEETSVELHKGKRVYKTLIKDLISTLKENELIYILGVDEEKLETVEPIYLKQYFTIIKEKNVKEKIIISTGSKKFKEQNLEYRELDKKYFDETEIVITQSKVYIFIIDDPYYMIIIKNKKLANTYKKQFELLWNIAKK